MGCDFYADEGGNICFEFMLSSYDTGKVIRTGKIKGRGLKPHERIDFEISCTKGSGRGQYESWCIK